MLSPSFHEKDWLLSNLRGCGENLHCNHDIEKSSYITSWVIDIHNNKYLQIVQKILEIISLNQTAIFPRNGSDKNDKINNQFSQPIPKILVIRLHLQKFPTENLDCMMSTIESKKVTCKTITR